MGLDPEPALKSQDDIPKAAEVKNVEVSRESHRGLAYLVFTVDCDWEPEHGMYVVYHKDKPAEWTTYDGLDDFLISDETVEAAHHAPPALFVAVGRLDVKLVEELLVAGADPKQRYQNQTPLYLAKGLVRAYPPDGKGWLKRLGWGLVDLLRLRGPHKEMASRLQQIIRLLESATDKA